ncbi:MAG TPA: sigma 54-interacting transcriptional regulator [Terriglobia bacterium]|nr:sigma 54-interacting transcriptional regulator [Terriglobia bacterium]
MSPPELKDGSAGFQVDRYQTLLEIADLIAQHRDLAGLFHDLARHLRRVINFDFLNYVLHDPENNVMRLNIIESLGSHALPLPLVMPTENSCAGWVWQNQQPLVLTDIAGETRFPPVMKVLREHSIRSYCVLPLTTAQRRLGALGFGSKSQGAYTQDDLEFLQRVAQQVAVAVDNALNYQTLQSYLERLARRRAEEQLRETQALFEQLFESAPDGVLVTDAEGLITRVNAQTEKMFGYGRAELQGQSIEVLVPERFRESHVELLKGYQAVPHLRAMGSGLELYARRKDGSQFPVEIMLSPIKDDNGSLVVLAVVRDITKRKRAEEALKTSEQQLQSILDNSPTVIYLKDLEGRYVRINQRFAALVGIGKDAARGKTDDDLFPKEMAERFRANDRKVFSAGVPMEFEEVVGQGDAMRTYISVKVPLFDSEGKPYALAGVSTDITERKKAEEALLLEVSSVLLSHLDIRELFAAISATLRRVMPHEYATLALYEPESKELRLMSLEQPQTEAALEHEMLSPMQETLAGRVMNSRQPLVVNDLAGSSLNPKTARRLAAEGVKSACFLPLIVRDRVLGTLNLVSRREAAFQPKEVELLSQVASHVAMALDNALAFRQVAELKERLAEEKLYLEDEIRTEYHFEEIIGESMALKRVLKQVETVGPTNATVLILGETGTGKELVARAIHDLSTRRDRTFIKLNCAAIPTGLLESELFGHEKGAFTGAIAQKIGRLELAHQGTLFLDEVGDIPLELQPKLLRALQEKEFERLGSTRTIPVDVRLIAATNRDLAKMVASHEFRSDLYYRLRVFPITVPPLRDRAEDIPILVHYFAQKHAERMHRKIESIPPETIEALVRWHWPGNIRELENIIERAVILSPGPVLRVPLAEINPAEDEGASPDTLEEAEREHILRVLREARGIIGGPHGAATRLGLKRTTLNSKMRKLGITREEISDTTPA